MRIETATDSTGEIIFVVHAESDVDRALLATFTSERYRDGRELWLHSYGRRDGLFESMCFGWKCRGPE